MPVIPARSTNRKIPANTSKEGGLCLKNNQNKRSGGMTYTVEHLPNKHKALSSSPSTTKNIKNKTKQIKNRIAICSSNSTFEYTERIENRISKRYFYIHV
jgi:hypothetical protein